MKIGVIGAGMIGRHHITNLKKDGRARVVAVCARTEDTVQAVKETFDIETGTTDYREIIDDGSIDAVVIATPPDTHAALLIEVLKSKKHILMEKPMVVTEEELNRVLAEQAKHPDLICLECSCRHTRLQPKFSIIKAYIDSGRLGQVYYIHHQSVMNRFRYGVEYHPEARWALNRKIAGGGVMMDWGVYDLSFHLGLLDDQPNLKQVISSINHIPDPHLSKDLIYDVEHHGACMMTFDSGLRYYYERGAYAHNQAAEETRIYGTSGGLKFAYKSWDPPTIQYFRPAEKPGEKPVVDHFEVDMSAHVDDGFALISHFIDCLEGKARPAMTLEMAAKHLEIINKIYRHSGAL